MATRATVTCGADTGATVAATSTLSAQSVRYEAGKGRRERMGRGDRIVAKNLVQSEATPFNTPHS